MKIEHILKAIKEAKKKTSQPDVVRLIDAFEAFFDLYVSRNQEHTEIFRESLNASYQKMWQAFDQAVQTYGMSGHAIRQYVTNPENFTADEWQMIEALKQEANSFQGRADSTCRSKRKRNKKGVRI